MDPPPNPPLTAVNSVTNSAANLPSTDSTGSSPHSRETESCDGQLPPVTIAPKLRIMCSHGGYIVPRPDDDKSFFYVGGDTRMVVVDRNISLAELSARIAKTLGLHSESFRLKYKMPNADLDSLVSLAVDEDVDEMVYEYDRFKKPRLKLFVFPAKSESTGPPIGSLLDGSVNLEVWFYAALNGLSDSSFVKGLLGFRNVKSIKDSNRVNQCQSVPNSRMMESTLSVNSMNSIPEMASLPPIRVRESAGGIRAQDGVHADDSVCNGTTVAAGAPTADDRRTDHDLEVGRDKNHVHSQVPQQQKTGSAVNSPKADSQSHPSDGSSTDAMPLSNQMGCQAVVQVSSGESRTSADQVNRRNSIDHNDVRVQLRMPVQEPGYMVQPCIEMQHQPRHYSHQQQCGHYVIQQPDIPLPMPAYYPLYPPQQQALRAHHQSIPVHQPQYPLYVVQVPQALQGCNMVIQQAAYQEGITEVRPQTAPIPSIHESANQCVICGPVSQPVSAICGATTTTAGAQPTAQVAQKEFVNHSQANHQPKTVSAPSPGYSYEIQDPARSQSQTYLAQPPSSSIVSQHQTMTSSQAIEVSDQPQNQTSHPSQSQVTKVVVSA